MICEICERSSCTRSFHLLEEQEQYDKRVSLGMSKDEYEEWLSEEPEED